MDHTIWNCAFCLNYELKQIECIKLYQNERFYVLYKCRQFVGTKPLVYAISTAKYFATLRISLILYSARDMIHITYKSIYNHDYVRLCHWSYLVIIHPSQLKQSI